MLLTVEKACRALAVTWTVADGMDDPDAWTWATHEITGMQMLAIELGEFAVADDLQILWSVAFRRSIMAR